MDWQIQKRSKTCNSCEQEFREGNLYHCTLRFEDGIPIRHDICSFCWNGPLSSDAERSGYVSYWKGSVKPRLVEKKEDPIQQSVAENLLRKYLHSSEQSHKNFCYVLALILERKKELVQRELRNDKESGRKLMVYEHPRTGETIIIEDPQLNLSEISDVQKQVCGVLEMERVSVGRD